MLKLMINFNLTDNNGDLRRSAEGVLNMNKKADHFNVISLKL